MKKFIIKKVLNKIFNSHKKKKINIKFIKYYFVKKTKFKFQIC